MGCRSCEEKNADRNKKQIVADAPIMIRFAVAVEEYLQKLAILSHASKNHDDRIECLMRMSVDAPQLVGWIIEVMNGTELRAEGAANTQGVIEKLKIKTEELSKLIEEIMKGETK